MFGLDCCLGNAFVCKDQALLRATEQGDGMDVSLRIGLSAPGCSAGRHPPSVWMGILETT